MDPQWNVHAGTNYPNRLVMTIENPIRIDYVHPQPIGDRKIAFHTAFVTPYGNYDVDLDKLQFEITTGDGQVVTPESLQGPVIIQKTWVHNHHFEPVLATWVWNYRQDGADPGDYQIAVQASNFQGTATAAKAGSFALKPQGVKTAKSGYLTHRLVDVAQDAVIAEFDCGTLDGIRVAKLEDAGEVIQPLAEDDEGSNENGSPIGLLPLVLGMGGALAVMAVRRRR
jgi:hypothetical protein